MLEQKNPDRGFSPSDSINQVLSFWWFLVGLTFLGGIAGFLIHQARPPVYEAVGHFSASIDYVATGPLTQYDEDVALNQVGNILTSGLVINKVIMQMETEGIHVDSAGLSRMAVVERRMTVWDVRIRNTDAKLAEHIARVWVEEGQTLLLDSYQHALQAELINNQIKTLENCLGKSVSSEPSSPLCTRYRFVDIQGDLEKAGEALYQERKASNGLFSGLVIGPETLPVLPSEPVMRGRNQLVLAGSVIGLLMGIFLFSLGLPSRWWKRN